MNLQRWARGAGWLSLSAVTLYGLLLLIPDVDAVVQKEVFVGFLAAGVALLSAWQRLGKKARQVLLSVLCVLAVGNMYRWSADGLTHIDHHDVTCYYLGGKYAEELGPFELYPAAVLADFDNRRWADLKRGYWAQSKDGFSREKLRHALKRGREVRRESFTKERWNEFERDLLALQDEMGRGRFRTFLVDKGFNATPAWIAYASPLIQKVPVSHVEWLGAIDTVLLVAALGLVATTFGPIVALWALFFFCTTISTKWLVPGSVILRYDWLFALLLAMCLLKRGRSGWAGSLVAVAGLLRVFPVVWMFGTVARLVSDLSEAPAREWWTKTRGPLLMLAAFFAVFSLGEVLAVFSVGLDTARDHAIKMLDHTSPEMISSKRPGLSIATSFDWELARKLSESDRTRLIENRPLSYGLGVLVLLLFGFALRKKSQVEAFAFGYVPFFLLSTGTYYYHVARITLVVSHASSLEKLRHRVSLGFLLILEVFSQIMLAYFARYELFWTSILSWGIFLYCVGSLVWILNEEDPVVPTLVA